MWWKHSKMMFGVCLLALLVVNTYVFFLVAKGLSLITKEPADYKYSNVISAAKDEYEELKESVYGGM
jgi:hypothetical protein